MKANIVIIGAGISGVSIAYNLAKKGVKDNQMTITINTEDMLENAGEIKVLQKEIELLKLQIEEIKVSTSNPLSN